MSEYAERWDVSKLLGASPGYVGYEAGGQLTNMVKKSPQSVLCLDEIEKAHPEMCNIFLQVFDDGVLTSSQGETVFFKDMLIIMTSNIGAWEMTVTNRPIGFMDGFDEEVSVKSGINAALKRHFRPEFLNRVDEVVTFNRLSEKHIHQICKILLAKVKAKAKIMRVKLDFDKSAVAELSRLGYSPEYGARPLRRVISSKIEDKLSDMIISDRLKPGDAVHVVFDSTEGDFIIQNKTRQAAKAAERNTYDFEDYEDLF
jgi:ATP-dependent Clp protease ATP-binding subunit ClpA